jgi:myosin heavy subunit
VVGVQTVRNNNSSRFGKWQEVKFLHNGRVYAARIVPYLLEKSRVTQQAKNERNVCLAATPAHCIAALAHAAQPR